MEYRVFKDTIFARLDKGEDVAETLKKICRDEEINLGTVSAIGAVEAVRLGYFPPDSKEYVSDELEGSLEACPITGNITTKDGELYLHLHANLADRGHTSYGGHLEKAVVSATVEAVIRKTDGAVGRHFNDKIGLNLLEF